MKKKTMWKKLAQVCVAIVALLVVQAVAVTQCDQAIAGNGATLLSGLGLYQSMTLVFLGRIIDPGHGACVPAAYNSLAGKKGNDELFVGIDNDFYNNFIIGIGEGRQEEAVGNAQEDEAGLMARQQVGVLAYERRGPPQLMNIVEEKNTSRMG